MQPSSDGCTCYDETTRVCPIHTLSYACVCEDPIAESCPLHTQYERVQKLLDRPNRPGFQNCYWEEVNSSDGKEMCICLEQGGGLPPIFVVRGSQMFRLKWPELPPPDPKKTPLR